MTYETYFSKGLCTVMQVRDYRKNAAIWGKMRFSMGVSASLQLCAVCVVMSCYERLLACHPIGGAVLIRYTMPVVWLLIQLVRWATFMLSSSTFNSEWRFMRRHSKDVFTTKQSINLYKLLLYLNLLMIVILGFYDAYLLFGDIETANSLFCEREHQQTHWTLIAGMLFLTGFHAIEAHCLSQDLQYEMKLILKSLSCVAPSVMTEEIV